MVNMVVLHASIQEREGSLADIGIAWSLALKLRNKKSGASHTQIPKNAAISEKPGGSFTTFRYVLSLLASFETFAK